MVFWEGKRRYGILCGRLTFTFVFCVFVYELVSLLSIYKCKELATDIETTGKQYAAGHGVGEKLTEKLQEVFDYIKHLEEVVKAYEAANQKGIIVRSDEIALMLNNIAVKLENLTKRTPECEQLYMTSQRKSHDVIITSDDLLNIQQGNMQMEDPLLIQHIKGLIVSPSKYSYNLSFPGKEDHSQANQAKTVDSLLQQKTNGFFIECGASDGEEFSNTLYLERYRNWTGILIEAEPIYFQMLLQKRRRAYALRACVSPTNHSSQEVFRSTKAVAPLSGLKGHVDKLHHGKDFRRGVFYAGDFHVQCYPLWSILLALGQTQVDYFSLDIEGPELEILKTIPLHKVRIEVITVEYLAQGSEKSLVTRSLEKLQDIRLFFYDTGLYREVGILAAGRDQMVSDREGLDVIFKRI